MLFTSWNRVLLVGALAFLSLAAVCALSFLFKAQPIQGVHPALKPFKFAISIALFLGSFSLLLPRVSIDPTTQKTFGWLLVVTMSLEMIPIVAQALRGTTSHFNVSGALNTFLWRTMQAAIVVATVGLIAIALLASLRPLHGLSPVTAFAWRAGLWLSLLGAVSGFRMGGALTHTVGGLSGGPGLPLFNWSRLFGDLRVSHFFSLHALQVVPVAAHAASLLPWEDARWAVVVGVSLTMLVVSLGTLAQALAGRPLW